VKYVLVGLNDKGQSTVAENRNIGDSGSTQTLATVTAILDRSADLRPGRYLPKERSHCVDLGVPARGNRFNLVRMNASVGSMMHHSDTIDFDVVVAGQVELVLEDGSVSLDTGDLICIPGLAHGWRTEGCTLAVVLSDLRAA
jgi:mannose-6-phosphate isomerase-like protein (cupin superfamily)